MSLSIRVDAAPFLNVAHIINDIPIIRQLILRNESNQIYQNVQLEISADQSCILPLKLSNIHVATHAEIEVPVSLLVHRAFFNALSESEKVIVTILIKHEAETLCNYNFSLTVHPLEFFGGFHAMPELIAAYTTPNHPYIYHIKRKAAAILEDRKYFPSFDGYQSNNPERVLQMMAALYAAIASEEIVYSALPPGFEATGQRLRLLHTIQKEKFANCIDLSLLFAACIEAMDLHPILIIVHGHAFIGCWLHDEKFSEVVNEDKSAITKRLSKGIREIVAFEATSICKGSKIRFSDAIEIAEARLVADDDFCMSIDIKRARTAGVRPLPLLVENNQIKLEEQAIDSNAKTKIERNISIGPIYNDELIQASSLSSKQKLWQRKLLDLSLRNNLLNVRMTRNMLQLVNVDINHLEDILSDGGGFAIMPHPQAERLGRYNLFVGPQHSSSLLVELATDELKYKRLLTYYHEQDLENILQHISKNAQQAIEENGSSTLYLALGLLKWYDQRSTQQARYAPILLVPVELSRRSVKSKFLLRSREEETMINVTLLELLRQEYELNLSGLEQLPTDEKGVDVGKVMATIRRAIMHLKGWDVEEQLILGNFSFNKLILWQDIVRNEKALLNNNMVRSLVEGKLCMNVPNREKEIDLDEIPAQNVALPIATDSSQLEAVIAAQDGDSFILHGPPGTGKSQTITNIIADALNQGKKVLFVAAKKAALDVVHKRLEQIGMARFTLELHSNKSKKSDVLNQLAASLEQGKAAAQRRYAEEAARLDNAKKALNSYVNLLHRTQPYGWSLYHSITLLEQYKGMSLPTIAVPTLVLQNLNERLWQQWNDWLPSFEAIAVKNQPRSRNPLSAFSIRSYTPSLQENIARELAQLIDLLPKYQSQIALQARAMSYPFELTTRSDVHQFEQSFNSLKSLPDMPLSMAIYLSKRSNLPIFDEWCSLFIQQQQTHKNILEHFSSAILRQPVEHFANRWKMAQQSWILPRWWQKRGIKKQLAIYAHSGELDDVRIEYLFSHFDQWIFQQQSLNDSRYDSVRSALGWLYQHDKTDVAALSLQASLIQRLATQMSLYRPNAFTIWLDQLALNNVSDTSEIKLQLNRFAADGATVRDAANIIGAFERSYGITLPDDQAWLSNSLRQLSEIEQALPTLKDWINYEQIVRQGKDIHLEWLITAYETEIVSVDALRNAMTYNTYRATSMEIIAEHESLSLFNSALFEGKIEQYKTIAQEFQALTIKELRSKLSLQIPNASTEAMQSSEIGILQRAIRSRGRGLSIRKLFDQIPTLLPRLAPCMLMSPISVAQYFDVETAHFDLVIFDEASQLPTCEAVSALARAKQAIIVGDPKQMPPTSFFATNRTDEDDIEIEDLESILDDCLSLSVPSKYLLRHYRSKHESLIAFSNNYYYDSQLLTFPSADNAQRKVIYHHVQGHYDKGKTRTNKFEANAIVQFIEDHYRSANTARLSLGVVTFSQTQQNLIESKLQERLLQQPELEEAINEGSEPLFIKNLENVQGDERDIILFSIGYAPDEQGNMSMNFGPLNRNGGWRRLNVAVTRARYAMHVFATLASDQIDLNRTSAEGVAGLKAFLQFAETGRLPQRLNDAALQLNQLHLCDAINKQLTAKGLQVHTHIGTSAYKIDLGIVHPHASGRYILGIIVDGYYYLNARTANDRERVMPSVLQHLGWNLFRIWTMDWFEQSEKIVEAIIDKVNSLCKQDDKPLPLVPASPKAYLHSIDITDDTNPTEEIAASLQRPYVACALSPMPKATSDTIYLLQNRGRIKNQIQTIVSLEAPISKELLLRKVLQAWNTGRLGTKLEKYLSEIIEELNLTSTLHHQPFYWKDSTPEINFYRSNDLEKRNIEDIAPEEIIVALTEAVTNNLSIEEEELKRYLARCFSFAKIGKQLEQHLLYALSLAIQQGLVLREESRIKVTK